MKIEHDSKEDSRYNTNRTSIAVAQHQAQAIKRLSPCSTIPERIRLGLGLQDYINIFHQQINPWGNAGGFLMNGDFPLEDLDPRIELIQEREIQSYESCNNLLYDSGYRDNFIPAARPWNQEVIS
jgi:hypothetical protein